MRSGLRRVHTLIRRLAFVGLLGCNASDPSPSQAARATAGMATSAAPPAPRPVPSPINAPEAGAPRALAAIGPGPRVATRSQRLQVPFDQGRPSLGPAEAPVSLIAFCDPEAEPCTTLARVLAQQVARFRESVRVQLRWVPITAQLRRDRPLAAHAALFAESSDAFWRVEPALRRLGPAPEAARILEILRTEGLDTERFTDEVIAGLLDNRLADDLVLAGLLGVKSVPTLFVNGRRVDGGALGTAELAALIQEELQQPESRWYDAAPRAAPGGGHAVSPTVYRVPLGGAIRGPADARVTVVAFIDYTCQGCADLAPLLERLEARYGARLRLSIRHNPVGTRPAAVAAAETLEAARAQGRFWELHRRLLERPTRGELDDAAKAVGLDMDRLERERRAKVALAAIRADRMTAWRLGVRGAPHFFVNGRSAAGGDIERLLTALVEDELVAAEARIAAGVLPTKVYAALTDDGEVRAPSPPGAEGVFEANPDLLYRVPVDGDPALGPAEAPVTAVIYGDHTSRTTGRAMRTLLQLRTEQPDVLRLVWKDYPHAGNPAARDAALAVRAAGRAGKFWEAVALIAAGPTPETLDAVRARVLEVAPDAALDDAFARRVGEADVESDAAEAKTFGAVRNPTVFLNGRYLADAAQSVEVLREKIAMELATRARYVERVAPGLDRSAIITGPGFPGADPKSYPVKDTDGPSFGQTNADVSLVVFASFNSREVASLIPVLDRLVAEDDVRVVWRNYPTPGDADAARAAEAMVAATLAGKPWAMRDRLLAAPPGGLSLDTLVTHGQAIGLDPLALRADLERGAHRAAVQADFDDGMQTAGAPLGSPTVFVGGRMIMGSHPIDVYREALAAVRALRLAKTPPRAEP